MTDHNGQVQLPVHEKKTKTLYFSDGVEEVTDSEDEVDQVIQSTAEETVDEVRPSLSI